MHCDQDGEYNELFWRWGNEKYLQMQWQPNIDIPVDIVCLKQ